MKVVFLDTVHEQLENRLKLANFTCIDATSLSIEECQKVIADVDGIVIRSRFRMDASFLKHAQNLKFIARSGAGMENIDTSYCDEKGIILFNAPEGNRNAVGEHALAMLLALFNKIIVADHQVRQGIWNREENRGIELEGKVVGIIGFGNNGSAFAKKLRGFDVEVLAYDKYKSDFNEENVREVTMKEIYEQADIVSFHIPQNEETIYLADSNFFDAFVKNIYLINLARGKIVKTSSLVRAMRKGKVRGACLDVLEYEKSSFESFFDQELDEDFKYILSSQNVILSPHVGGWTTESYFKLSDVLADKILAHYSHC